MQTIKLFLASSAELEADRKEIEIMIARKNHDWVPRGIQLKLEIWENFLDAMSQTRLQDEYDKAIVGCDIFVMLFCTKVGMYTEEEFETAFKQFKATNKPFIYTYFKDAQISTGSANEKDLMSLFSFKKKLAALGHFHTAYKEVSGLKFHFNDQLDKLAANGFIKFDENKGEARTASVTTNRANLSGGGAIAQGPGATALAAGAVFVRGGNSGTINTGTQITAGNISGNGIAIGPGAQANVTQGLAPHQLELLIAPILAAVAQHAPQSKQAEAVQQVQEIKAEVSKGKQADDGKVAKLIDGLVGLVPGAVSAVVSTFATPILGGIAGPVTKYVLDKFKPT